MAGLKKIMIMPYFGTLPEWYDKYELPKGYDLLLDTNIDGFKKRVKDKLGIEYTGAIGSGKPWDYRACLGYLYEDEIKGYDFYGHTDFDCVYGDVDKWISDEFLSELDVHSNHHSYINGCWSLYRNTEIVTDLFTLFPAWKRILENPNALGWVEQEFSRVLEQSGLRYKYTFWQGWPYTTTPNLVKQDGKLYQDGEEVCMFHFRRSKRWPL